MGHAPPASGDLPVECAACGDSFHATDLREGATVSCTNCSADVVVGEIALAKRKRLRWSSKRCEQRLERIGEILGPPPPEYVPGETAAAVSGAGAPADTAVSRLTYAVYVGLTAFVLLLFGLLMLAAGRISTQ